MPGNDVLKINNKKTMKYTDDIHGQYELPPIIENIIETPYFKRLKKIKQLGVLYLELNQAKHTRYEHCIGTYYLTNVYMDALERNTANLKIPEYYRQCVNIAGLLHDVGHGPFSHFWETVSRINNFQHEKNSWGCIDKIFKIIPNKLSSDTVEHFYGIELIKALIAGDKNLLPNPVNDEYEFIFDIVHNSHCEIDVDKWDYLKRDYHHVGIHLPKDQILNTKFEHFFTGAKVTDNRKHIAFKYEDFPYIYGLFEVRENYHLNMYQRPITKLCENILLLAISSVDQHDYKFSEKNITEISSNDTEFLRLNDDSVIKWLESTKDPEISKFLEYLKKPTYYFKEKSPNEIMTLKLPFLRVSVNIEHAGQKLPFDKIPFYGNPSDLPNVQRKLGFHEQEIYFKPS